VPPEHTVSAADRLAIDTIRILAMDAVEQARSGHPSTPMALAPLMYTLWLHVLGFDPEDPSWQNRDRFVLSGMALAGRSLAAHFNPPLFEGVASEAASFAGNQRLGNLCWIYDDNRVTIEGRTKLALRLALREEPRRHGAVSTCWWSVDAASCALIWRRMCPPVWRRSPRPSVQL